jgi:hypothetical protein
MRSYAKYLRAAISFAAVLPLIATPASVRPAVAQTAPSCQPGYYYASDGYCYPQPQPTYAYPPPVYDPAPPVYQPAPDIAGVAIGVGLGLLAGALVANHDDHGDNRQPVQNTRRRPVDRGGDHGHH